MKYTVDYFINKFEAIPEERWTECYFSDGSKCCANGHCGIRSSNQSTEEALTLREVFKNLFVTVASGEKFWEPAYQDGFSLVAANVNDGRTAQYQQPTPKQRILAALYDIKKMQQPEVKEKIVYVAVPVTITEQAKELVLS